MDTQDKPEHKIDLSGLTLDISSEAMEISARRSLERHRKQFNLTPEERKRLRTPLRYRRATKES